MLAKLLEAYNNLKSKRLELENIQAIQNAKSKELGIKAKNKEDISELKSELDANKKELQSLLGIVSEGEISLTINTSLIASNINSFNSFSFFIFF